MANQLFARKPLALLLEEMAGDHRLRRVLGPVQLTSLGVGAVIGTGIFVLTGVATHDRSGPAMILSFAVAGFACALAALCYAEFASMTPVAGSALHLCLSHTRRTSRHDQATQRNGAVSESRDN
jgi:APA family basic amino acid/polyamine antiporter